MTVALKWEEHYVERINAHYSNKNVKIFVGHIRLKPKI